MVLLCTGALLELSELLEDNCVPPDFGGAAQAYGAILAGASFIWMPVGAISVHGAILLNLSFQSLST
ncbi:hypothetical protein U1Q18_012933, partial [Sarracenia purpurea var. burkii]